MKIVIGIVVGLLLVVVLCAGLGVGSLVWMKSREDARRAEVVANLKKIGEALHAYEDSQVDPVTGQLFSNER